MRREFVVAAGDARAYDEADWHGALVVIERGSIELETTGGARRLFRSGDILWLTGLSIRALHNPGKEPAVLVAVTRRRECDGNPGSDIAEK
jgi:hypothetical protein